MRVYNVSGSVYMKDSDSTNHLPAPKLFYLLMIIREKIRYFEAVLMSICQTYN